MKSYEITLLCILSTGIAHADIFKCTVDGKSVYQAAPCVTEESEKALKIRTTSEPRRPSLPSESNQPYITGEPVRQVESPIMAQERIRLEREYKHAQIERERASAEFNRALAGEAQTRQWEAERSAEQRDREIELQRQRDKVYQDHLKKQRYYR